jgi:hypothetical protein
VGRIDGKAEDGEPDDDSPTRHPPKKIRDAQRLASSRIQRGLDTNTAG